MFRKFLIICCLFVLWVGCFNPTDNSVAVLKINNSFVIANADSDAAGDKFQSYMEMLDNKYEDSGIAQTLEKIAKYIPGPLYDLLASVKLFTYYGIASRDADTSEIDVMSFIMSMASILFNIESDDTTKDYPFRLAKQISYKTNQYCIDQQIYIEETNLISKQGEGRPSNGNAIYPVYPETPGVKHNYCSRDFSTFKKGASAATNDKGVFTPLDSRCSYTYSSENESCLLAMAIPTLVTYYVSDLAYKITELCAGCLSPGDAKDVGNQVSTARTVISVLKVVVKIATDVFSSIYNILNSSILDDSYSLIITKAIPKVLSLLIVDIAAIIQFAITLMWHCIFIRLIAKYLPLTLARAVVESSAAIQHKRAKKALQTTQFCGWDWLSWSNDYDYDNPQTYRNVPTIGINEHSRSMDINNCIDKKQCDGERIKNEDPCQKGALNDCTGIKRYSYDIRNKFFREYKYGGKEYSLNPNVDNFYLGIEKSKDAKDNRTQAIDYEFLDCIDPRLPQLKGYDSLSQRYYMRGNQKANFACNRFFYDGSGCLLREDYMQQEDIGKISLKFKRSAYGGTYYYIDANEYPDLANKYYDECNLQFKKARGCCRNRSENFVCLEKIEPQDGGNILNTGEHSFCMSNVITSTTTSSTGSIIDFIKDSVNQDKFKDTCEVGGDKFEATKKKHTQYICVFANGFCPYNFRLNGGLNYRASFCDSNTLGGVGIRDESLPRFENHRDEQKCKGGIFYGVKNGNSRNFNSTRAAAYHKFSKTREGGKGINNKTYNFFVFSKYLQEDMEGYNRNDFDIIYDGSYKNAESYVDHTSGYYKMSHSDFIKFSNGNISKVKNFCQYRAHCVEVEKEQEFDETYQSMSLFMDSACFGSSTSSRVNTTLSLLGQNVSRQLSAPVAECIYESLSNLVMGVAGNSKCNAGYELNNDGYCDEDSKEDIEEMKRNNPSALEEKYAEIDGVLIIKGDKLPDNFNPFKKLQKNLLGAAKALVALFIAIWGFQQLYNNKIEELIKFAIGGKFGMFILGVAVTMWLGFGTGLYDEVFVQIKRLSVGAYMFMNEMFISNVNSKHNIILNRDGQLRKIKLKFDDKIEEKIKDYPICYHYSSVGNLFIMNTKSNTSCPLGYNNTEGKEICVYTEDGELDSSCADKMVIRNNQNIQALLYFMDKYNADSFDKLLIYGIDKNGKETNNLNDGEGGISLWNNKYDGCYFSIYEYPEGKEYLSIFDTLDCKLARYLGLGYSDGLPNLFVFAVMSMIPDLVSDVPFIGSVMSMVGRLFSAFGTIIFTLAIAFFFGLLNIVLKVMYIFVSSFFSLSILLFLCPIFLPMMLFGQTRKMFDNWKNEIFAAVIQPMLNISVIILFLNVFDNFFYSGITFNKFNESGRIPSIECSDNAINIMCSFKGIPVISDVKKIIQNPSTSLYYILNILIALLFVMFGDKVIDEIKQFTRQIITFGGGGKSQFNDAKGIIDDEQEKPTFERLTNISRQVDSTVGTVKSVERLPLTAASRAANKIDDMRMETYENTRDTLLRQQELESKRADGSITERELTELDKITNFKRKEELESKFESSYLTEQETKELDRINEKAAKRQEIVDNGAPTRKVSEFVGAMSDPINYTSNRIREKVARDYNGYNSAMKTFVQASRVVDSLVGALNKDRNNGGFLSEMKQIDDQRKFDNAQRRLNQLTGRFSNLIKDDLQKATDKYRNKTKGLQKDIKANKGIMEQTANREQNLQDKINMLDAKKNKKEYKSIQRQLKKTKNNMKALQNKNARLTAKQNQIRSKIYNNTLQGKKQDAMKTARNDSRVFNWQHQDKKDKK